MATEDFTTYTETDPNSRITVTSAKVSWSGLTRNETAYVYADKGAAHFSGDFTHHFDGESTSESASDSIGNFWMLANAVKNMQALDTDGDDYLACFYFDQTPLIFLRERDSSTNYQDFYSGASATQYWYECERDETVGTYGTIYLRIYSDSGRTTLLDTLSVTLHTSKKDFQYIYATNTLNSGTTSSHTGYVQNLDLAPSGGPVATGKSNPFDGPFGGPFSGPIG